MELEDLVSYAILIAVAVAIILMVTGKFIDLSVERQTSVQSRATINLLQDIVTESPILMTDSNGNKLKLVIDKKKYNDNAGSLIECCDSVQYDYKFGIGEYGEDTRAGFNAKQVDGMPTKTNYVSGSGDFELEDPCYTEFGIGLKSSAKVPVNVCEGGLNDCKQRIASIETTDTPLSELSYWIAQACSSKFAVSKRIPLSLKDYQNEGDITVDSSKKEICLHNNCKKFSCDGDVNGDRPDLADKDLFEQKVPGSIFALKVDQTCNFVKVVRDNSGTVSIIEAKAPPQKVPRGGKTFFIPDGKDAWTEGKIDYFSTDGNHEVENDAVAGVAAATDKSKKYIVLKENNKDINSNIHDTPLTISMRDVPGALDCGGENCIDMKKLGLYRIGFQTRVWSSDPNRKEALMTWKLFDSNGKCVEKDFGIPGSEKERTFSDKWTAHSIDLLEGQEAESKYGGCRSYPSNAFGTDSFPSDFDWKISRIEWSVCEVQSGFTCLTFSSFNYLLVDNLYFEGVENEQ